MSARLFRRFVPILSLLALVVLVAASSAGIAGAGNSKCKKVAGGITVEPVSDPSQCPSVYGCGTGTIKGDIKGSFSVVTTSFVESPDSRDTGVAFTTSDTVFTTSNGALFSKDAVALSMLSGDYAEVITITGGTKSYAGAKGTLTATGGATATGGSGSYSGSLCLP